MIALALEAHQLDQFVGRSGLGVIPPEELEHLDDGEVGVDAGGLQHDADAGPVVAVVRSGIEPEHPDVATRRRPEAFEDLDSGGLARTVGAEQGEDLAELDREVDASDSLERPVRLDEPADLDGRPGIAQAVTGTARPRSPNQLLQILGQGPGAGDEHVTPLVVECSDQFDHIGIGGDYDGIGSLPEGMEDVSKYPDLIVELLRRGYSDDDVRKVLGLNLLRAMRGVEAAAMRLQKVRGPSDALIEDLDAAIDANETTDDG